MHRYLNIHDLIFFEPFYNNYYHHRMSQDLLFGMDNLLCEFTNTNQEEFYIIKRDIYIESDRSLRHDPSPNPNKPFRLTRGIYENYITLIRSIKNLNHFLNNYKFVLNNTQKKRLLTAGVLSPQQSLRIRGQLESESLPLIINKIVLLKERQEKQAISYAINKLKIMVLKARYKETTQLQHLTETYITKLKNALIYHVRYREDKAERNKLLQLQVIRNQFIIQALSMIKKKYDVIELKRLHCYKIQPTAYLQALRRGIISQRPIFFINFFTESVLFISEDFINFDENLLFCPIVRLDANTNAIKISDQYLKIVSESIGEWAKFQLYVEVFHIQTNTNTPFLYSKLKDLIPIDLHADKNFPERIKDELKRLQSMLDNIDSIKRCVFGKMLLHWMQVIFDQKNKPIQIIIQDRFKVVIRGNIGKATYETIASDFTQFKPEILTNLLLIAGQRKNVQKGRKQLRQSLRAQLEATIFKLVAEKVGTRVSWPLECSSMGHYYYEYNSDRITNRGEVKKFFNQF